MSGYIEKNSSQSDDQLELIARTVAQNQQGIADIKNELKESVAKKSDIDTLYSTLDEILGLVKKKDQELTFMGERVGRVEKDVTRMKPLVGLV